MLTPKKKKPTRKTITPRNQQTLRRVLLGLGIGVAAITAIIAALHFAPLLIALLSVLGLCAALAVARRLLNPFPPALP